MKLEPDTIVYYCKTEFFLRPTTVKCFTNSGYNIVSHVFSNAETTFKLSKWAISQVIFDRERGITFDGNTVSAMRYEVNKREDRLDFVKKYTYDNVRPCLTDEIVDKITTNATGMRLGQWTKQGYCLVLSNRQDSSRSVTTNNLKYALMLKGLDFNTHGKYFETSNLTYRGRFQDIPTELAADAIMFSQFYKGLLFSNKGNKNYIMPFTAEELGCNYNELNKLLARAQDDIFRQKEESDFDFREFFHQFDFSLEAKDLYNAALRIFLYYHHSDRYEDKNWNDSFYDITVAFMNKDVNAFQQLDTVNDTRITKVKTTKGTHGFSRMTFKSVIPSLYHDIFIDFFNKRDVLAEKINAELLDSHLLLWKRGNIY